VQKAPETYNLAVNNKYDCLKLHHVGYLIKYKVLPLSLPSQCPIAAQSPFGLSRMRKIAKQERFTGATKIPLFILKVASE
jgi:hypothetical protein